MDARTPEWLASALRDYAARLRASMGGRVHDIRLFGSWARGEAGPDSDVDVFVLVDVRDEITREVPFALCDPILFEHGVNLSPTVMDEAEWRLLTARERRFARDIAIEGVAL